MDVIIEAMRPKKSVEATGEEMKSLQIIYKPFFRGISFLFGSVNAANSPILQKKK